MAGWWAEAFIRPTHVSSTAAVGTPTAGVGVVLIEVIAAIPSGAVVGAPTVIGPPQILSPTAITSSAAVGSPVVGVGVVGISPATIAAASAVGAPTVQPGTVTITPTSIASQAAVQAPNVSNAGQVPYPVPFTI